MTVYRHPPRVLATDTVASGACAGSPKRPRVVVHVQRWSSNTVAPLLVVLLSAVSPGQTAIAAGPAKWTWEAGKQTSNGSINVKSVSGDTTYSGTQNPSGAVARSNQTVVTQPPTVIIQATATLQVKAPGDACTAATSGTAPNQSADEGTAITADRTTLLTCQSGVWAQQTGGGLVGGFRFKIGGYGEWVVGTGRYNPASGIFGGMLFCDPTIYGASCGSNGTWSCGTSASCARDYAGFQNASRNVHVVSIPVYSVTQTW